MGKKDWSPLPPKIFVAIVGDMRDPWPIIFSGHGTEHQFKEAWRKANRRAVEKFGEDDRDYEYIIEEMGLLRYQWMDREYLVDM